MIGDTTVAAGDNVWEGAIVPLHDAPIVLPHLPGVYMIRHTPSYKVYVGSSQSLLQRMHTHVQSLMLGTHYNQRLQALFRTEGIDKFDVVIVHVFPASMPVEGLVTAEQKVIDETRAWMPSYGFNVYRNADYRRTRHASGSGQGRNAPAIYLKGHDPSPDPTRGGKKK